MALVLLARGSHGQTPDATPEASSSPPSGVSAAPAASPPGPIALVPLDNNHPDSAAKVTGAIEVFSGKAVIAKSGTVTSGIKTTEVTLPRRGVLRVCASTSVHLSADASVPAGETPGLMMALDHGALEASFATGQNSDTVLTPDFRILIGGPGSSELKIRLGQHGDTCIDNPGGANAPYVVVSSVFEGGAYRVQPGQRVMFQHGSLKEVVDQEKEPCGCPPEARPGTNDFPLAQSAGLAPLEKPAPATPAAATAPEKPGQVMDQPLVYTAPGKVPEATPQPSVKAPPAPAITPAAPSPQKKKPGLFRNIGRFFKKIFGAE
ncbi:MAG TPA: hypothetical protein VGL00_00155 [Terracidiphilus sp.]